MKMGRLKNVGILQKSFIVKMGIRLKFRLMLKIGWVRYVSQKFKHYDFNYSSVIYVDVELEVAK